MLQENENEALRLKGKVKEMAIKKAKKKFLRNKYRKFAVYASGIALSFFLIFYPIETGTLIGRWVHLFVGSLVEAVKNG